MAKKKKEKGTPQSNITQFFKNKQTHFAFGWFLMLFSFFLLSAFVSFFSHWYQDQSQLAFFTDKQVEAKNVLNKIGASLSHFFIYKGFGIASFIISFLVFITGYFLVVGKSLVKVRKISFWAIILMLWISIFLALVFSNNSLLSGVVGFEWNEFLQVYIGKLGVWLLLILTALLYFIFKFKWNSDTIKNIIPKKKEKNIAFAEEIKAESNEEILDQELVNKDIAKTKKPVFKQEPENLEEPSLFIENENILESNEPVKEEIKEIVIEEPKSTFELNVNDLQPTIGKSSTIKEEDGLLEMAIKIPEAEESIKVEDVEINIEKPKSEAYSSENLSNKLVDDFGEFDPTLELSEFKFPTLNLLKDFGEENINIDKTELEANKNKIVTTLNDYKIGIKSIVATVGPTITLYEIVPEAGVRISKIKNLEDDIALSLSALGIRIIAPIPGKGTIGIEVPNKTSSIVSMRSAISSMKFQNCDMELPIAFGKTISNETFVADLAKMPHMLMAGATGQGKSVGLNAVLTSLLYKKHPAEVKFVLIDPKKVELTLFNKIERHYLAKLPDTDEAIITDTSRVVATLNSLCSEMDNRYDLLKLAFVRNIKEYNEKFKKRKLNPENGHRFLPYIVLVIDEFADLMMTAGKEVETPIARLAQLARAIGIHLIVATQRPSVNVITGIIKANFPARVAFRVTSKIDSRTILDASGADQLIGKGDMLVSIGSKMKRIQCAFVDTPEVERITDFIGSQRAYPEAYLLPEYITDESGINLDINKNDRDSLFEEAANVIVSAQQGSASLLQRKLKLGYNRAGRIIDQLEAAGIVGPFQGSKARDVLIPDILALENYLKHEL